MTDQEIDFRAAKAVYTNDAVRAIHKAQETAQNFQQRGSLWTIRTSSSRSYSRDFAPLFYKWSFGMDADGGRPLWEQALLMVTNSLDLRDHLGNLIRQKQKEHGSVRVLDLMSYGAMARKLGIPAVSVGLVDIRTPEEKKKDEELGSEFVKGDIFQAKTWKQIEGEFDIAVCRPKGPLYDIPPHFGVYFYIFNKVYQRLSFDNGVFVSSCHEALNTAEQSPANLAHSLDQITGLEARFSPAPVLTTNINHTFMFVKHPNAPKKAPICLSPS